MLCYIGNGLVTALAEDLMLMMMMMMMIMCIYMFLLFLGWDMIRGCGCGLVWGISILENRMKCLWVGVIGVGVVICTIIIRANAMFVHLSDVFLLWQCCRDLC